MNHYMAKLHSKKKGKSGSKRPKAKVSARQVDVPKEQVEEMVVKSVKEGVPFAKIGLILRDKYAVPNVRAALGVKLRGFLKTQDALPEYPPELLDLIRKAVRIRNHLKASNKDVHNKVKLIHIESKIHRLVKYYTNKKILPADWKYNPEKAALLVK